MKVVCQASLIMLQFLKRRRMYLKSRRMGRQCTIFNGNFDLYFINIINEYLKRDAISEIGVHIFILSRTLRNCQNANFNK